MSGQAITSEVMVWLPAGAIIWNMPRPEPSAAQPPGGVLGSLLREWRAARRLSQLDLALDAGVSTRHLSYVETGKAQPSREMVVRLAETLHLPLRERNALLIAAGFAPVFPETVLGVPELAQVRTAIGLILEHQKPYPAFVLDRHWNMVMTNRAAVRIIHFMRGGPGHNNVMRQVFDPQDLRPAFSNWEEIAGDLLRHLHDQVAAAPWDVNARALLNEVIAYPGVPDRWRTRELGSMPPQLLTVVFRRNDQELRFFSTMTTFVTPRNVTLDELRIECSFPADEATAQRCRVMACPDRDG
jgi:transcriptional regulator with XRE-family HTH domain